MPIPEFNQIKAPALQFFSDGQPHHVTEVYDALAKHFQLTESDLGERLPSGTQSRWHNRANWACYDLYRAGLLIRPKRGSYQITDEGKKVAAEKPGMINREFLMRFPPFVQFVESRGKAKQKDGEGVAVAPNNLTSLTQTPEEQIEAAFGELRETLIADLLSQLAKVDPFRFEQVVLDLLVAMGYGGSRKEAAAVTQKTGDEGIDGVINEDRLGLDVIYIQAKRWKGNVGRREIQSFVGALAGKKANKGIFITTSGFHDNATEYVDGLHNKVILIDGRRLAELMIEHGIGVAEEHAYSVKKIDSDYFDES
jgi:restriction system protein